MVRIRAMRQDDWPAVQAIYAEGIATRAATFETEPPDYATFDASHYPEHRLVAVEDGRVVGWAALAPTSPRACYAGVAENSVYVAESARRSGVGRALMESLLASAEARGIWTVHAGMFPENAASRAAVFSMSVLTMRVADSSSHRTSTSPASMAAASKAAGNQIVARPVISYRSGPDGPHPVPSSKAHIAPGKAKRRMSASADEQASREEE